MTWRTGCIGASSRRHLPWGCFSGACWRPRSSYAAVVSGRRGPPKKSRARSSAGSVTVPLSWMRGSPVHATNTATSGDAASVLTILDNLRRTLTEHVAAGGAVEFVQRVECVEVPNDRYGCVPDYVT